MVTYKNNQAVSVITKSHESDVVEITTPLHIESHSVTRHPAAMTFPLLPQPKLVLDLVSLEGCKAELTWVVVISQDSLPDKDGHLSQKHDQAESQPGTEPPIKSHKSNDLHH